MKNDQNGFMAIEGLLILIIIGLVSFTGWFVYHSNHTTNSLYNNIPSENTAIKASAKTKVNSLSTEDIAKLQATQPTSTTVAVTPKSSTSSSTAGSNSYYAPSTPATTPAPAPTVKATVTISSDGCHATGIGTPGMTFVVGAYGSGHGGDATYTLPASGTLTEATGGFKDMSAYGSLTDSGNTQVAFSVGPITSSQCPSAGS